MGWTNPSQYWTNFYLSGECEPYQRENTKPTRGLFEVYIVDSKDDSFTSWEGIAANEASARLKAAHLMVPSDCDLDDYDIIVRRLGDVRAKTPVQEVRTTK